MQQKPWKCLELNLDLHRTAMPHFPPNNMFPFLLALSANLRNMLFPCLKSAELRFSRIYHLMAKFWPTITLCSLCQSTYMTCNHRAFFSHPPSNFAMSWKKLRWVALAFPCCARNDACLLPESCSSNPAAEKAPGLQHATHGPTKTYGHSSTCNLWRDQGHEVPAKKRATLNKFVFFTQRLFFTISLIQRWFGLLRLMTTRCHEKVTLVLL